jgi:hypothetical protein
MGSDAGRAEHFLISANPLTSSGVGCGGGGPTPLVSNIVDEHEDFDVTCS